MGTALANSDLPVPRDRLPACDERDMIFDTFVMLKAVTPSWVGPIAASCGCQWKAWDSPSLTIVNIVKEAIHVMASIATLQITSGRAHKSIAVFLRSRFLYLDVRHLSAIPQSPRGFSGS